MRHVSSLSSERGSEGSERVITFHRPDEDGTTLHLLLQFLEHVTIDPQQAGAYVRVLSLLERYHCPNTAKHLCLALERELRLGHLSRPLVFCLGAVAEDAFLCAAAIALDEPSNSGHAYGMLDLDMLPLEVIEAVPSVYLWILNRAFRRRINNKTGWNDLAAWFEREVARSKVSGTHAELLKKNDECRYVTEDMRRSLEMALATSKSSNGSPKSLKNGNGL